MRRTSETKPCCGTSGWSKIARRISVRSRGALPRAWFGRPGDAGARADRRPEAGDVGDPPALEDVADLVVGMAVIGRAARLHDPDELRDVFRHQHPERPLLVGALLLAVGEADGHGIAV